MLAETSYRSTGTDPELPLSAAQLGFFFAQQLDPENADFNVCEYLDIHGPIDPALFEAALRRVIFDTDVLRVRLVERAGEPRQVVAVAAGWSLPFFDMSGKADPAAAALSWMSTDRKRPADLLRGPLFAFALFKISADRFFWYARYHHVLLDGLSRSLIARRVADIYTALAARSLPDSNTSGPLAAIIADDAAYRASDAFAHDRRFFIDYLDGATDPPSIAERRFVRSSGPLRRTIHLHAQATARLRAIGRLSRLVTAATAILMHRLTRTEDLVLGLAVAARSDATRSTIGMAANVVPLRLKVDPDSRVGDLVAETDRQIRSVLPHQRYRFTDLRRDLHCVDNDRPIFAPVVNIQPFDYGFQFAGAPVTLSNLCAGPVEDLTVIAYDHPGTAELRIDLDANPALYGTDVLAGHGRCFLRLLEAMADPDATIAYLDMLSPDERRRVLTEWNLTQEDYPTECMIDELVADQAKRTPERTAAIFETQRLSYGELNSRAERLARQLRALGVGPDIMVALFLERSLDMVVGMLGVLKAGGAYIPLDPSHPHKRIAYMLADAQPLILLTHRRLQSELPPHRSHVVVIDAEPSAARPERTSALARTRNSHDLAYVIYTSGSTGEPKGVEIEHRALVNMLTTMRQRPGLGAEDTMLAITTLAFDIAALEIFLPLSVGACVVIAASETIGDGVALADLIERSGASVLQATPTTLSMLLESGWTGARRLNVLCGGEAWTAELASKLLRCCGSVWNMYGPTETTVWSAVAKVEDSRPIVIGPPIANTRFYVLDGALQPVPVGVPGELHIGGDGLARGYLHRPELTRERFVADPFAATPGTRMYRTGDMVRRLSDGTLEFLGRLDHQVKIRGHRIEPGEIEVALERQPGIERCAVVAREDAYGSCHLVAYIILATDSVIPAAELRRLLHEIVPAYMIPTAFVPVASFPLTPTGKLDRKALPPPHVSPQETDAASLRPRTPTEEVLVRIWCEVLGLKDVGLRDNFFELGGHSILTVRVIGKINATLGVKLGISDLFRSQTIELLAASIERIREAQNRPTTDNGSTVVQLQEGRGAIPVYLIDAGPEQLRVANWIDENHPVFAIEVRLPVEWCRALVDNRASGFPDLEQLAALYVAALTARKSSSACVLVGHSVGGLIAFEVAHQFKKKGGDVAVVMLLDTWGRYPTFFEAISFILHGGHTRTLSGRSARSIWRHLRTSWQIARWFYGRIKLRSYSFFSLPVDNPSDLSSVLDQDGIPVRLDAVLRLYDWIREDYRPRCLKTRGVLFRANALDESGNAIREIDGSLGWNVLFSEGLEVIAVTGDHVSIVHDSAHVTALARQINEALDRYSSNEKNGSRQIR